MLNENVQVQTMEQESCWMIESDHNSDITVQVVPRTDMLRISIIST